MAAKDAKITPKKVDKKSKKSESESEEDDDESSTEESAKYAGPIVGDVIGEKYKVIRQLGEGGFGAVFQVMDSKTNEFYAVKVELKEPPKGDPGLPMEGQVLKRLQGYNHVLRYVDEGRWGPNKIAYLVMQLAGPSLEGHRKKRPQFCLSASTTSRLAIQCIDGICQMHFAGFLHRDIKPGNYAMGTKGPEERNVFVLDFGLVRQYLKDGKVRPKRHSAGFRGSVQYASINAHKNVDLGRCDDYWCWLYSMIQLRTGKLPWRNFNGLKKVGSVKMNTSKNELLEAMEPEYHKIYDNLVTLKYEDTPPVAMYREQLLKIITRLNVSLTDPFDWEMPEIKHVEAKIIDKKAAAESKVPVEKPMIPQMEDAKKMAADNLQYLANFLYGYVNPPPNKIAADNVNAAKEVISPPKLAKEAVGPKIILDTPVKQAINKLASSNQAPVTVPVSPAKVAPQRPAEQDVKK